MSSDGTGASLREVAQVLAPLDDIVICGHVSPDGDCIGSQLGLAAALKQQGKRVTCLLAKNEPIDYGLHFLPGIDDMVYAGDFDGPIGAFVSVDVPNADRMGNAAAKLHAAAPVTVTIDHHPASKPMSQVNHVDVDASAAALIVWDLAAAMGVELSSDIATCCYTGLVTDTGRFQYQNTDAASFSAASAMIAAGADPSTISQQVYQNRSLASLKLEMAILQHMEFYGDGAFAVSYLSLGDFQAADAQKSDAEPLIDVLRSLRGVRVACILREQEDNVRGSLRAKDDTDVSDIAANIGGGGHRAAAGFTFNGSLDDARACIAQVYKNLEQAR